MNDMHSFEQQLASGLDQLAGPRRSVDAMAISRDVIATQSPKWRFQSMFSATKFVVAGAIAALFGGFLLSGVLTQQPSDDRLPVGVSASATAHAEPTDAATSEPEPTAEGEADEASTALDLLPGVDLVTEEVEPGVLRIVSDGVRDLAVPLAVGCDFGGYCFFDHGLDVAPGGGVGVVGPEVAFRLGDQTESDPAELLERRVVDSEGAVWGIVQRDPHGAGDLITVKDGRRDRKARDVEQFAIHPDGALFMVRETKENRFGLIGPVFEADWRDKAEVRSRKGIRAGGTGPLLVDPTSGGERGVYTGALARADAGWEGWELSLKGKGATFPLSDGGKVTDFAYGPDGTSWRLVRTKRDERGPSHILTRVSPGGDPVRVSYPVPSAHEGDDLGIMAVALDGAVWLGHSPSWTDPKGRYGGLLHFDGEVWTPFLVGHMVIGVEITPDGTAWVQAAAVKPPDWDPDSGPVYDKDGTILIFAIPDEPR